MAPWARAAIKDVGRVLDVSYADVDRITKLIPTMPLNIKLAEARKMEPQIDELARKEPRILGLTSKRSTQIFTRSAATRWDRRRASVG